MVPAVEDGEVMCPGLDEEMNPQTDDDALSPVEEEKLRWLEPMEGGVMRRDMERNGELEPEDGHNARRLDPKMNGGWSNFMRVKKTILVEPKQTDVPVRRRRGKARRRLDDM